LLPLKASSDAVAAYLRREGDRAALVVANLGSEPLSGVTLTSEGAVLPAGTYAIRSLLGSEPGRLLHVQEDGRIQGYLPLHSLGPMESHLFDVAVETP
jgi:hypothetical protein